MYNFRQAYTNHIERAIQLMPEHEDLLRLVLLNPKFLETIGFIILGKTEQTLNDKQYHNSNIGFNISNETPQFACFEVGTTHSLDTFRRYWIMKNYDNYEDYVIGILEPRGFNLYKLKTGNSIPKKPSNRFVSRFLFGHILMSLQESILLMSIIWLASDEEKRIYMIAPELI